LYVTRVESPGSGDLQEPLVCAAHAPIMGTNLMSIVRRVECLHRRRFRHAELYAAPTGWFRRRSSSLANEDGTRHCQRESVPREVRQRVLGAAHDELTRWGIDRFSIVSLVDKGGFDPGMIR
jgi:hypothetical protein